MLCLSSLGYAIYAIYFMIIIFGLLERCICRSCTCSEIGHEEVQYFKLPNCLEQARHGQCRMCRPPPGGDWSWKREVETDAGDAGDASCSPRKVPGMQGSGVRCTDAVSTKLGGFWGLSILLWILVDQGALRSLSLSLTERSAGAPLAGNAESFSPKNNRIFNRIGRMKEVGTQLTKWCRIIEWQTCLSEASSNINDFPASLFSILGALVSQQGHVRTSCD